jgi:hypothetical protein
MTSLKHSLKQVASIGAAVTLAATVAFPQAALATDTAALRAELTDYESRLVAPPFLSAAQGDSAEAVKSAIFLVEALLDFPATGYMAQVDSGSVSVSELLTRALSNRATLVNRACGIVDTAAPSGRPSVSSIALRLNAMQTAMQSVSPTVSYSGRSSLSRVEDALADIAWMMETLGLVNPYIDEFDEGSISVSELNAAVDDIYDRASQVCGAYGWEE